MTTQEDILALRAARRATGRSLLEGIHRLAPPPFLRLRPDRHRTAEGWEPFVL